MADFHAAIVLVLCILNYSIIIEMLWIVAYSVTAYRNIWSLFGYLKLLTNEFENHLPNKIARTYLLHEK